MPNPMYAALQNMMSPSNAGARRSASSAYERTKAVRSPYEEEVVAEDEAAIAQGDAAQMEQVQAERDAQQQGFPSLKALAQYGRTQAEKKMRIPVESAEAGARAGMDRLIASQDAQDTRQSQRLAQEAALQEDRQAQPKVAAQSTRPSDQTLRALSTARSAQGGPITSLQRFGHKVAPGMFGKATEDVAVEDAVLNLARQTGSFDALSQVASQIKAGVITLDNPLLDELDPDEREALAIILERN